MPKYIGEYTIEVDVIELIDGFIFNTILQDFTINAIDFDITDVNGNINQDVKNQIAENAGGAGGFLNIEDDIRDTLDDLLVASYFNQTIWGANTAYIKDGEFELIYEFSSNGIYFGGTYTVTITLIAANYNVATVTCEFFIQTLSTLEDGRALFNDGSGVSSTIDYFSGSTYVIDLSTNVNYLKLPYLKVIISIKNADDSTTAFSSTYNYNEATNDQVWAAMPKFVGKYVVTVTVIETIGDTDYTTTSTTNVEIYGKLTNEIKENTANIEQALDGFVTKEGAELYTSILEKLTVDLFVLSKTVYVVDWNDDKTLQVVVGLYELSMDDFTIVIRDEAGNVVTSITENGTFFVTVIYNGYSNGNIYTAYSYDYQIMFEVTPRITLDSEGVESTVLFYTSRNITSDNIDYYNNGSKYYFMIDTLTAFNNQTPILVLNNHVITVTMVDADGKTYEFTYYDPYFATTSELSGLWSNIPKIAGVYTVSVAIYYLYDDYTVTKTFENKLTINEITSITIQTTRDDIDLTNLYQSNSSLANSITSNYISSDGTSLAFVNANGQEVSTITYFNEATNSFEEIAMTLDNFDIKFYKDGVEVDEADVKNSGDYVLAISLKDKYNTGYFTETMTFTQLFTIHPKPMN